MKNPFIYRSINGFIHVLNYTNGKMMSFHLPEDDFLKITQKITQTNRATKEIKENFEINNGKTAACAANVELKFSRQAKNPLLSFLLKNFSLKN